MLTFWAMWCNACPKRVLYQWKATYFRLVRSGWLDGFLIAGIFAGRSGDGGMRTGGWVGVSPKANGGGSLVEVG